MDEKKELQAFQKQVKQLTLPFERVARVKSSERNFVANLEKQIDAMPSSEELARQRDEVFKAGKGFVRDIRRARSDQFGRIISGFVSAMRDKGVEVREADQGWRLGSVELKLNPEASEARILYNREVLEPSKGWGPIGSVDDLDKLFAAAQKKLKDVEVPDRDLGEAVHEAYDQAVAERRARKVERADTVPLSDFYREFRLVLTRRQIRSGRPDVTLKYSAFPKWAYLHNLDRYRKLTGPARPDRALSFQTCSQAEQNRQGGFVLGGLDPLQQYKTFCAISRPAGGD